MFHDLTLHRFASLVRLLVAGMLPSSMPGSGRRSVTH